MSDDLHLTIRDGANGKLAIINRKTYTLPRLYRHRRLGGVFCLVVAGKTRLRTDDLAKRWRLFRHGSVYLALKCRPFSYHLVAGRPERRLGLAQPQGPYLLLRLRRTHRGGGRDTDPV